MNHVPNYRRQMLLKQNSMKPSSLIIFTTSLSREFLGPLGAASSRPDRWAGDDVFLGPGVVVDGHLVQISR